MKSFIFCLVTAITTAVIFTSDEKPKISTERLWQPVELEYAVRALEREVTQIYEETESMAAEIDQKLIQLRQKIEANKCHCKDKH